MDTDDSQQPLITFDDVDDEPNGPTPGQNEQGSSANSASLSEESLSVCGGSAIHGSLEIDSTDQGEAAGSGRMSTQAKDLDASGMEDMIQKILEKYGETDEPTGDIMTQSKTSIMTSQDAAMRTGGFAKREADTSVSDMIQRESSKWDRVYGTEDNQASGSSRDRTGRQEAGREPVTLKEEVFTDYVEIGSVIRSQTGVAKRLISVSEGLDEVNDDLENMKRELKRIQTKAYNCLEGGDLLAGQTAAEEFVPIAKLKDADIYGRKNEWVEEREGVVRFDDEIGSQKTDGYWNVLQEPSSYLPGVGRAHITERDINLAHLLTIAEPVESYGQARSLVNGGAMKRDRHLVVDRFGRPTTQLISDEDSSSRHHRHGKSSHAKPDGYCYMCEEFGEFKGLPTYDEPIEVVQKSKRRTYQSRSTYDELPTAVQRSYNSTYHSMLTNDEPTSVVQRSQNSTYHSSLPIDEPTSVFQRSNNNTHHSMLTNDDAPNVVHRSHSQAHSALSMADLDQTSLRRSREDQGGIYKTPSGVYFYSDDPDEAVLYPDGITRSYNRQSSVPRGISQSQGQSATAVARPPSQSHRASSEFTSRFLTKVRRRNSLGGRPDTDRYRAQSLTAIY